MKGNNMAIKICYNCGKNDHVARDCKKKKKGNSGNLKYISIFFY